MRALSLPRVRQCLERLGELPESVLRRRQERVQLGERRLVKRAGRRRGLLSSRARSSRIATRIGDGSIIAANRTAVEGWFPAVRGPA